MKLVLLFALASFAVANGQGGHGGWTTTHAPSTWQNHQSGSGYSTTPSPHYQSGYGYSTTPSPHYQSGNGYSTTPSPNNNNDMYSTSLGVVHLPSPDDYISYWCTYDQLKIDRKQCESRCWPARNAGCGSANGPQEWAAKCQKYSYYCHILDHGPATTTMPYNQGTNNNLHSTTSAPYNQPPPNHQSGPGYWTTTQASGTAAPNQGLPPAPSQLYDWCVMGMDSNKCTDACNLAYYANCFSSSTSKHPECAGYDICPHNAPTPSPHYPSGSGYSTTPSPHYQSVSGYSTTPSPNNNNWYTTSIGKVYLPMPNSMLGHWCSYDQLKFDRKQCEDGCLPAKDAGCDSANGPQEWAAKCQTYYDICKVLEYSPATTPPPYHQGTNNNWQSTTSEPYDQSKSNDASACGVGTKMEDGKCVINYSGLKEMCYMASKNNWGWTCKALSQCSAPSPFNN